MEHNIHKGDLCEEMDIDENDEKIEDLSFKLEEMDIDTNDNKEKEVMKERSNLMDEKIKAKEKRNQEKEILVENEIKDMKVKRKREEEIKLLRIQKENKQRKQKIKDFKKKRNKNVSAKKFPDELKNMIPNIQHVPKNCSHLVNEDDLVYLVPGDGCCAPNCAAAFLFLDEVYGPNLRKNICYVTFHWKIM